MQNEMVGSKRKGDELDKENVERGNALRARNSTKRMRLKYPKNDIRASSMFVSVLADVDELPSKGNRLVAGRFYLSIAAKLQSMGAPWNTALNSSLDDRTVTGKLKNYVCNLGSWLAMNFEDSIELMHESVPTETQLAFMKSKNAKHFYVLYKNMLTDDKSSLTRVQLVKQEECPQSHNDVDNRQEDENEEEENEEEEEEEENDCLSANRKLVELGNLADMVRSSSSSLERDEQLIRKVALEVKNVLVHEFDAALARRNEELEDKFAEAVLKVGASLITIINS